MPYTKQVSKRKRRKEVVPVLGAVGVSLLAGGASAATSGTAADIPFAPTRDAVGHQFTLNEEEITDVSLGTFYVFDKESAPLGPQLVRGGCGGRGCGGRGCGGRGCGGRGCGCGGRGCGRGCGCAGGCGCGCGCCLVWGVCAIG
jgi:hypothetical protein